MVFEISIVTDMVSLLISLQAFLVEKRLHSEKYQKAVGSFHTALSTWLPGSQPVSLGLLCTLEVLSDNVLF